MKITPALNRNDAVDLGGTRPPGAFSPARVAPTRPEAGFHLLMRRPIDEVISTPWLWLRSSTGLLALALLLGPAHAAADRTFPGLQAVLTPAEWQRAGLDRLSPDELGVIDAALIRHQGATTSRLQTELATARQTPVAGPVAPAVATRPAGKPTSFGLPSYDVADWRTEPPLRARVLKWDQPNRFRLDNGQVWEGFEVITYEILNKEIEIHARPHDQYTLVVDGQNTKLRVIRIK